MELVSKNIERQTDGRTDRPKVTRTGRQKDRQRDRQTGRQTYIHTDRQTDRLEQRTSMQLVGLKIK